MAYLYGEDAPEARARFETHLQDCAACAGELGALASVRRMLGAWAPPDARLGFRVVQDGEVDRPPAAATAEPVLRAAAGRPWWSARLRPVWNLALAATLVLVVAAALASVEVRYGDEGFVLRLGWWSAESPDDVPPLPGAEPVRASATPVRAPRASPVTGGGAPAAPWRAELAALEEALRAEIAARRAAGEWAAESPRVVAGTGVPAEDDLLREIRSLIAESERRQQQGFASGLINLAQEFDLQRRADQLRVQEDVGSLADYLVRVAGQPGEAPAAPRRGVRSPGR